MATADEELLLAIFGKAHADPGQHVRREGNVLRGPSSVGKSERRGGPVELTVRVSDLGLVQLRHERTVDDSAGAGGRSGTPLVDRLDQMVAESSADESLVHHHRAFVTATGAVAVEVATTLGELGTRSHRRKIRGLETGIGAYLR